MSSHKQHSGHCEQIFQDESQLPSTSSRNKLASRILSPLPFSQLQLSGQYRKRHLHRCCKAIQSLLLDCVPELWKNYILEKSDLCLVDAEPEIHDLIDCILVKAWRLWFGLFLKGKVDFVVVHVLHNPVRSILSVILVLN